MRKINVASPWCNTNSRILVTTRTGPGVCLPWWILLLGNSLTCRDKILQIQGRFATYGRLKGLHFSRLHLTLTKPCSFRIRWYPYPGTTPSVSLPISKFTYYLFIYLCKYNGTKRQHKPNATSALSNIITKQQF